MLPAHLALLDITSGLQRAHVIGALAHWRVADHLAAGPAGAAALAERAGVDADVLHRVLRAAAEVRVVRLDRRGRFRLTRLGQTLRSDHPHSMRDWSAYLTLPSTAAAWADLPESVRTGRSAFRRVHGKPVWGWFAEHPDEERLFAGAMRRLTEGELPFILHGYPWPETGVVCDVAGGAGTLLGAILSERPGLRGVLVDAPGVLAAAGEHLERLGVRERVELREGDIFAGLSAEADLFVMKNVLHDWDDQASLRILRNVVATMRPGSRLVLIEMLQPRNRADVYASLADIQMLTQCEDGRERSAGELRALLEAAGLRAGKLRRTGGPALLEGLLARSD